MRTQYHFGSLLIESLQLALSVGRLVCWHRPWVEKVSPSLPIACHSALAQSSIRGYAFSLGAMIRNVSSADGSRGLAEELIPPKTNVPHLGRGANLPKLKDQVLDRTKVLHGPLTQTYGETNYLKIKFWTKPRYCMVLGLKPMGKTNCLKEIWTPSWS